MLNPGDLVSSPHHEIQSYYDWPYHSTYPMPQSFTIPPNAVGVYIRNRSNQHGDSYWLVLFGVQLGWVRDTWLHFVEENYSGSVM